MLLAQTSGEGAALAQRLGFGGESKGRAGLVLAATMGTMTPGFSILPANVPNMGLYGAVESIYHIQLAYFDYLTLNFPVLGIAAMLVYPSVIWLLFREPPVGDGEHEPPKAWSAEEFKLLLVLLVALALWVTDRWHGISPAWVALGAALIIVAPRVGVIPVRALARELDYGPVLFVAGIIGLGAVATETGLGSWLADRLLEVVALQPGHDARNYAIIVAIATVVETFGSAPRPVGSHLVVDEVGVFCGSVSGGCVEGEVVTAALDVIEDGSPRLLNFGVADEVAWRAGLPCGGDVPCPR